MSEENATDTSRCASCGVKEDDDIKLKNCTACYLVKYCGVKCQKEHRKRHKRACKKRAAELHDELLFKQPESSCYGDCPICFLPLPIDGNESLMMKCCSKMICAGCSYANLKREIEGELDPKCPFCRAPAPESMEEADKLMKDRAEMNDPVAMSQFGSKSNHDGDHESAFEYWSKAAEMGDMIAHHGLAGLYRDGDGVERDEAKSLYHDEQAAIGGHPMSRHNLGTIEWNNDNAERAIKHWIIAAKLGFDYTLQSLKEKYAKGLVGQDDFTAALLGHHAAVDATKSPQREEAVQAYEE